jgi:hypothetical protein
MLRWLGASLVLLSCIVLATGWPSWDVVLVSLGSRGLHASELFGFVIAAIGVAALWAGGPRR